MSSTPQNLPAAVGVDIAVVVSIWKIEIWKGLRCLFLSTGFRMNYHGKNNAIQPHRWAELSVEAVDMQKCPQMVFPAEDQFVLQNGIFLKIIQN